MRRHVAVLSVAALAVSITVPVAFASSQGQEHRPARYLVGGAVMTINPTPGMLANDDFYLGGYGFGSGHPANQTALPSLTGARFATGILGDGKYGEEGDGVHSRSFAVSDGRHTTVLSQIETQGYFAAYKQGPFGINEIRQDAAARIAALAAEQPASTTDGDPGRHLGQAKHDLTAPPPTASEIVVNSDHSHGGPDTVGVWGGVPTSYLKYVHDQTVDSIVAAWQAMRPATLTYGIAHAGVVGEKQYPASDGDEILTNQFAYDPANAVMDDEVRVLQARDPDTGEVLDTYVNFAAHPTVLGSSNHKVTGDYVGRLNVLLEQEFDGFAMDQVATLGREQPARTGCPSELQTDSMTDDQRYLCALDEYAGRVVRKVHEALDVAQPLTGAATVAMNSYLLSDTTTSPVLAGIVYGGSAVGAPVGRAPNAPWYTGTQVGTTYFVGRIGHILITGGPGEMYAQIWQKVKDAVTADHTSGITSVLNIGTAGDFLGYIIAPLEAYPEPIRRSMLDNDNNPSPIDNDNYFFNISHTFGERLTCDLLRGAGDVLTGDPQTYWSTYERCPAFATDLVLPPGQDTQFPRQPDLSALLTHM